MNFFFQFKLKLHSMNSTQRSAPPLKPNLLPLGFEHKGKTNLRALLNWLSVHLPRQCYERFGPPLMLDESTSLTIVINSRLNNSLRVQCMLCPKSHSVLIAGEAVGNFTPNSGAQQWIDQMIIWSSQTISIVVPVGQNHFSPVKAYSNDTKLCIQGVNMINLDFQKSLTRLWRQWDQHW